MLLETEVQSRLVSNSCTQHNFQSFSPCFVTACCMHMQILCFTSQGCVFYIVLNQGKWNKAPRSISNAARCLSWHVHEKWR